LFKIIVLQDVTSRKWVTIFRRTFLISISDKTLRSHIPENHNLS
jgi:hypothetical protein